jgi:hypothetical protein
MIQKQMVSLKEKVKQEEHILKRNMKRLQEMCMSLATDPNLQEEEEKPDTKKKIKIDQSSHSGCL